MKKNKKNELKLTTPCKNGDSDIPNQKTCPVIEKFYKACPWNYRFSKRYLLGLKRSTILVKFSVY